jgi:hypothetical protein
MKILFTYHFFLYKEKITLICNFVAFASPENLFLFPHLLSTGTVSSVSLRTRVMLVYSRCSICIYWMCASDVQRKDWEVHSVLTVLLFLYVSVFSRFSLTNIVTIPLRKPNSIKTHNATLKLPGDRITIAVSRAYSSWVIFNSPTLL